MFASDRYYLDIGKIHIAHEYVLDRVHSSKYPGGRGQYGLVYALSGEVQYRFIGGETLTVKAGDLLLLSPTAAYMTSTPVSFRHYTVNFDIHPENSRAPFEEKPYCVLRQVGAEPYRQGFKKLISLLEGERAGSKMLASSVLYELLSAFLSDLYQASARGDTPARLFSAKTYIEEHFDEAFSLEQLAAFCSMSTTNFRREWSKVFPQTPMQYRDHLRIVRAKEYLSGGQHSVSEVASMCGYEDTGYFVRFFKKHTGVTPGTFKKNLIVL